MRANKSSHLDSIIRAFTLYETILTQLAKGVFYQISDENIKHDFEIKVKKHNESNIARRTIPEYFHFGDDDDDSNIPSSHKVHLMSNQLFSVNHKAHSVSNQVPHSVKQLKNIAQ